MENKKRKGKDEKDDDEVEEEMKMDKFYALLRRFRDARDRRRKELEELEKSESKKRKVGAEQHSVWVPSFEREDFTNDVQFRGHLCVSQLHLHLLRHVAQTKSRIHLANQGRQFRAELAT
ncbi:NIM1-INTERACTING 1 [Spatholobus suberectus]|nr:NIM1-INTERACTING 1 [Spatholobus suberectus]